MMDGNTEVEWKLSFACKIKLAQIYADLGFEDR